MAPITKDSVEVANPAGDTPVSQASSQSKSAPGLRSDAVSLEVPVKVHGSRVVDVARGTAPQTEPFEEQTVTMIVFPQGAVLRMTSPVNVSQMLVLTNLKTKQDSICRVMKVRPNANLGSYVEVEFTHRQAGYWGVAFSSEGPAAASTIAAPKIDLESQSKQSFASPQTTVTPAATIKPPIATSVRHEAKPAAIAPPSSPFVPTLKPESSFISIGSQERVQEAASATLTTTKPLSPVERRLENPAPPVAKIAPAVETPLIATPSFSIEELRGDDDAGSSSATLVESETSAEPSTGSQEQEAAQQENRDEASSAAASRPAREIFGNFGGSSAAALPSGQSEAFGARLDGSLGTSSAQGSGAGQNWMLIAACIAVVVVGLGAGIFYFRQHGTSSGTPAPRASNSAPQSASGNSSQLPAITPPGQPYMAGGTEATQPTRSNSGTSSSNAPAASASVANDTKTAAATPNHSPAPAAAKQPSPSVTSDMMSNALSARPTTSTRGGEESADQAPALDPSVAASGTNALPGISSPNAASLPSPEMRPEGPVKIGGDVKEPKLITGVPPQYPPAARASGTQGDVVIETTIDKSGSVVRMHVVSGPSILRPAALDALRRWKYQPSKLDGEPVEVQMQVTIKFRL